MDDVIKVTDQFYIVATTPRTERSAVLQHGDTFAVFDQHGDIGALGGSEEGLYHEDTRYLCRFRLLLNDRRPLLLSARLKDSNELFGADLTNPDLPLGGDVVLPRDIVHLFRGRFVWEGTLHERLRLWNYGQSPLRVTLTFDLGADFADIFEVRGMRRERRGSMLEPQLGSDSLRLGYRGLDAEERWTIVEWSEPPTALTAAEARFEYDLPPQRPVALSLSIRCERRSRPVAPRAFEPAFDQATAALDDLARQYCIVESSSERFNQWVRRSAADLRMLTGCTPNGSYPYAGVPWFSTPFGRDGIITALQTLWVNPNLARGVLGYLADHQAEGFSADQDAEPGKILHETRACEMARLGEVPFGHYYGSVDATPLFLILAGAYFDRSGDQAFMERLWPHVDRALDWIDRRGDRDGDGFVEYARRSATGLVHQGWKDSGDSVFHADGSLAEPPIALCEVQAYVYEGKRQAAAIAAALGHSARAQNLLQQAEELRRAFEEHFWCEDLGTYALALDGSKRACRVKTSNAGHCLFAGIASPERARRTAETLVGEEMFSGWGIRTVAPGERRYNPMSYHNGSIWPHDNGLIAAGFSRYGFDDLLQIPFAGLFDASLAMEGQRLPELFCGFHRRPGDGPTLYPVACSPQAWASGVVFHLMQAALRLQVVPELRCLRVRPGALPPFLDYLRLRQLQLPFGEIDLLFERTPFHARVTVLRKRGAFDVQVVN